MVSQEQAEQYVEKLTELIEENEQTNKVLVRKSYANHIENAKISLERRILDGEFPMLAQLRKKFGVTGEQQ